MSRRGDAPLSFDDTPAPGVPALPAPRVDTPAFGATEVVTASGMPAVSATDLPQAAADVHEAPTRMMALATDAHPVLDAASSETRPGASPAPREAPKTEPGLLLKKPAAAAAAAPPPPPPPPAPAPKPTPAVGARAASAAAREGLPPLPFQTSAVPEPPKRPLPRAARLAIGAGALLLVLIVIGNLRGKPKEVPQLKLERDVAVHEEDLRKRREVTPTDFTHLGSRPRSGGAVPVAVASVGPAPPTSAAAPEAVSAQELEARRERRGDDPADLRGLKPRASEKEGRAGEPAGRTTRRQPRELYMDLDPASDTPVAEGKGHEAGDRVVVAAGASLSAALETPIHLTGGGATSVVALVTDGPQKGARLLGTASYSSGRVTLRFRNLITRDGEELDIRGEARGADGGFGLPVDVGDGDDDEESAESSVAKDTGTEVVASALGGLGGSVVRDYSRSKRQRMSRGRKEQPIDIAKGEAVSVFVQSSVTIHYAKQAMP